MNILLTSCGLETDEIKSAFIAMLPKPPENIRAMFITTAAVFPDAVQVLPKCLNDLLKCGISNENIFVYDLHYPLEKPFTDSYDVIYLCGGSTEYLLKRINENGFRTLLSEFIRSDGVVVGVSAGSMIFSSNFPDNLGLLCCGLDVHCSDDCREKTGAISINRHRRIKLGNRQAILFCKNDITVI